MSTHNNFIPINIAIVTISDTRILDNDKSGDVLEDRVLKSNHKIISRDIVKDNFEEIYELFSNGTSPENLDDECLFFHLSSFTSLFHKVKIILTKI